ncbi:transglutaminaseTgpA domain-containing protein [Kitasatospora sp. NPDC006697]|uniref:transglutaminase family protein n=1 Tax=Kitasatospora sp. NPDC006697 TaxID=3364020 RepID=UPI0036A3E06D
MISTQNRLTFYAALATLLAAASLTPLLATNNWVMPAALQIAVVAGIGAGLRRLPVPRVTIPPVQLVVMLYLLLFGSVSSSLDYGVLPGARALQAFADLLNAAGNDISTYSIPAPATPGLRLVLVGSTALVAVLVDTMAVTFRRAALAGLPLLALYCVGSGLNAAGEGGARWLWFLLAGTGYLMLLFAEGRDKLTRWGRVFRGTGTVDNRGGLPTGGHGIGVLALACALVIGAAVPATTGLDLVTGGFGNGDGNGHGGSINALNPVVSLTDGLRKQTNQTLIRYHGDDPALRDAYLRITALDEFDGTSWKPATESIEAVPGTLPLPDGQDPGLPATDMTTQVSIENTLSTQWLPAPYPMKQLHAPGNWRYEPATRSVIGDNGQQAAGLSYSVVSMKVDPTADQLRQAGQAPQAVIDRYTKLPENMPSMVADLARQVTGGKQTAYDQAVALQDWFTTTGGFTYSTEVDAGIGADAIAKFLEDKKGYCVHFAASMAAMARTLHIPARVAVGFAPGEDLGDGNFQVGSKDYHAWPELYFAGVGWLRFEPTPSRGVTPDYSGPVTAPAPTAAAQQPTAAPSAQTGPTPESTFSCPPEARRQGACRSEETALPVALGTGQGGVPWQLPAALAGGLLVLLLLLSPMLWRRALRRRRLGGGRRGPGGPGGGELSEQQVLAAWAELIDTAWDLGIPPDDALSPRHTVRRISEAGELDEPGREAVGRVALATERVLYARDPGLSAPLGADVRTVRDGLWARAGRRRRVRAVLLPPSAARVLWRGGDRMQALRRGLRARTAAVGERLRPRRRRAD